MRMNEFIERLKELNPDGNLNVYLLELGNNSNSYDTADVDDMDSLQGCYLMGGDYDWYVKPKLDGNKIVEYLDKVDIDKITLKLIRKDWWEVPMTVNDLLHMIGKHSADGNIVIRANCGGDIATVRKQSLIMHDFYNKKKKDWIKEAIVIVHV